MSTHYIEEAERLADEVAVMAKGKVISRGRPADLIAEHAGRADRRGLRRRRSGWPSCARRPRRSGLRVRPAGPAIAIVGSEQAGDGIDPRGCGDPRRHARGRLRPAHRGGGGVSAETQATRARCGGSNRRRSPA